MAKWTLAAFAESQDEAGAYTKVAAVVDQHLKATGDIIYIPDEYPFLMGYYALMGAVVPGNPYLDSPSLRAKALLDLFPVEPLTLPTAPPSLSMRPQSPTKLKGDEGLMLWSNANPAAAEYHSGLLWLSDGLIEPVKGDIFTVRFTAAVTGVAGAWANGAITLAQTLPAGRYAVVGAGITGANLIAARFVPIGHTNRPGMPAVTTVAGLKDDTFRYGKLGKWFDFDHNVVPSLDILVLDACVAQVGYLDLIQIS